MLCNPCSSVATVSSRSVSSRSSRSPRSVDTVSCSPHIHHILFRVATTGPEYRVTIVYHLLHERGRYDINLYYSNSSIANKIIMLQIAMQGLISDQGHAMQARTRNASKDTQCKQGHAMQAKTRKGKQRRGRAKQVRLTLQRVLRQRIGEERDEV